MLRYFWLIPLAAFAGFAVKSHKDANELLVEAIHPDDMKKFSHLQGMTTADRLIADFDLFSEYNQLLLRYDSDRRTVLSERSDLLRERNNYAALSALMGFLFLMTFFPWARFGNEASSVASAAMASGQSKLSKVTPKFGYKDRLIIKRDGLDRYSVSTELKNWKDLLDEGVVSEEEFEAARSKLLGKG